ncbi:MAG: helix-turn-helix transcriptional regulator [Pseudomonadota bacterium]
MTVSEDLPDFMTTQEVADLLRVKQRRVYDLAASGGIPHTRATGKLLFRRQDVQAWLSRRQGAEERPRDIASAGAEVIAGSHDPLLDWALRASGARLPSFFDGSLDGLERVVSGQASACGMHVFDAASGTWNIPIAAARLPAGFVLVGWAERQRGLILAAGADIRQLSDLAGQKVVARQPGSGADILFRHQLAVAGVDLDDLDLSAEPARTESEAASAIANGAAVAAPGLACMAREYKLDFLPLTVEHYDIAIARQFWFQPAWQRLMDFAHSSAFAERAGAMAGYDISALGQVRWNGD